MCVLWWNVINGVRCAHHHMQCAGRQWKLHVCQSSGLLSRLITVRLHARRVQNVHADLCPFNVYNNPHLEYSRPCLLETCGLTVRLTTASLFVCAHLQVGCKQLELFLTAMNIMPSQRNNDYSKYGAKKIKCIHFFFCATRSTSNSPMNSSCDFCQHGCVLHICCNFLQPRRVFSLPFCHFVL